MGEPVPQDSPTELVAPGATAPGDVYRLHVTGNRVLVAGRPDEASTGAELERNRFHDIEVTTSDRGVYVISPGPNDADVDIVKQGALGIRITSIAPKTLEALRENRPAYVVQEFTLTAANTDESPAAQAVPDGYDVLVLPLSGNTGDVLLKDPDSGDSRPVGSGGITLGVTDLSDLTFRAPNAGDGVDIIVEE